MTRLPSDILTIILVSIPVSLVLLSGYYDVIIQYTIFGGAILLALINISTMILSTSQDNREKLMYRLDFTAMLVGFGMTGGLLSGEILAADAILPFFDWNVIPFGFYMFLSFTMLLVVVQTMSKIPNSVAMVIAFPIIIVALGARTLLSLWDLFFPPRMRELVPYLDVTRELILNISVILSDPKRLEAETALDSLGDISGQMDELTEGYALRKGVGQSIDVGLTIVVFAFLGVLTYLTDIGIPPQIIALFFASLALAFSTFAGLFGPFYGLAGACKEFSLRYGNYRAASIYKIFENIMSIPFNVASAGFLFLDLPPIDADTLEDFKTEMQEQLDEITGNISALLGRDKRAIPKKTQKMIVELAGSAENSLNKLDFRNLREETAREFALTYFQHEFSWKPWARKTAVKEFAGQYHFDQQTGEENLKLIGDKIKENQMDEDMVNNIMVSAALRGIVAMEEKYQETLADIELGQTCTGLAFGARQFLKDHYIVQRRYERWAKMIRNFFLGILAIPIVTMISFHNYANRFYDHLVDMIVDNIFLGNTWDTVKLRSREILEQVILLPEKFQKFREKPDKTDAEKKQRNWELRRKFRRLLGMIWEVLAFPFIVLFNAIKWVIRKFGPDEEKNPRESFEEAVAHTALVAIYDELFKRLVMQTHVSTGY